MSSFDARPQAQSHIVANPGGLFRRALPKTRVFHARVISTDTARRRKKGRKTRA
jgi:hypothetical protein